jgi:uncharacterized protein
VRFWDSSAIVPLLTGQAALQLMAADDAVVVWWGTETECVSAISRLERSGSLTSPEASAALARLDTLASSWQEVQPTSVLRRTACRLLRVHQLRAGDALQLAAAILVATDNPATLPLVTSEARLADAAHREGFTVLVPGSSG